MKLPKSIFITGTDTGVGKTVVTASLAYLLLQSGKKVSVVKPVQTGTSSQRILDIEFVYRVLNRDFVFKDHCYYSFFNPLSPKAASELEKTDIDIEYIKSQIQKQRESNDIVVIEGAGGLLVPVTKDCLMADLAKDLESAVIIVTRPSLGTINHTLLTVEAAKARGLLIMGIVINNFPNTPGVSEKTNPQEILRLTGVPIIGVIYEDKNINVEKGDIGSIRQNCFADFASLIGGIFDFQDFVQSIDI